MRTNKVRAKGRVIIPIDKQMKIKLLRAIQAGELDMADFPELDGPGWDFYDWLTDVNGIRTGEEDEIDYNLSEK